MPDPILQKLLTTSDPAEKAAFVAEYFFSELPQEVALAARRCIILHWFDRAVVEAVLQDVSLSENETRAVYEQLVSLPFIEEVAWGRKFQDLTREGLLKHYAITQPELLKTAARLAATAYEVDGENEKIIAEAVFCYLVAGEKRSSMELLSALIERAKSRGDWLYVSNLLQLQEEAECLAFVQPLPLTEHDWMLRGLVQSMQGKHEAAVSAYSKAIALNAKNAPAYLNRGGMYTAQKRYKKALVDYNRALQLDRANAQAYLCRGITYAKQENYTKALQDFTSALRLDPKNAFMLHSKGLALNEIGLYEEALTVYEQAIDLDPYLSEAHAGKGKAFLELERYTDALAVYEQAIDLDPTLIEAYLGKGRVLFKLKRYELAQMAYEQARAVDPLAVHVDAVQGHQVGDEAAHSTSIGGTKEVGSHGSRRPTIWLERLRKPVQSSTRRTQRPVWNRFQGSRAWVAVAVAFVLILGALLVGIPRIFSYGHVPSPGLTPAQHAQGVVEQFYKHINAWDYADAYKLFKMNSVQGGYCSLVDEYMLAEHDEVIFNGVTQLSDGTFRVAITIVATELFATGPVTTTYVGYEVVDPGTWQITNAGRLDKTNRVAVAASPTSPDPIQAAQAVVQQFHGDINRRDYPEAYSLWGADFHHATDYCSFVKGYSQTRNEDVNIDNTTQLSDGTVQVLATINATEGTDAGPTMKVYHETYIVGQENGAWRIIVSIKNSVK